MLQHFRSSSLPVSNTDHEGLRLLRKTSLRRFILELECSSRIRTQCHGSRSVSRSESPATGKCCRLASCDHCRLHTPLAVAADSNSLHMVYAIFQISSRGEKWHCSLSVRVYPGLVSTCELSMPKTSDLCPQQLCRIFSKMDSLASPRECLAVFGFDCPTSIPSTRQHMAGMSRQSSILLWLPLEMLVVVRPFVASCTQKVPPVRCAHGCDLK
jgi:hypothetical protein